jgi:hypothetical protein
LMAPSQKRRDDLSEAREEEEEEPLGRDARVAMRAEDEEEAEVEGAVWSSGRSATVETLARLFAPSPVVLTIAVGVDSPLNSLIRCLSNLACSISTRLEPAPSPANVFVG